MFQRISYLLDLLYEEISKIICQFLIILLLVRGFLRYFQWCCWISCIVFFVSLSFSTMMLLMESTFLAHSAVLYVHCAVLKALHWYNYLYFCQTSLLHMYLLRFFMLSSNQGWLFLSAISLWLPGHVCLEPASVWSQTHLWYHPDHLLLSLCLPWSNANISVSSFFNLWQVISFFLITVDCFSSRVKWTA